MRWFMAGAPALVSATACAAAPSQDQETSLAFLVAVVMGFGALGGFVDGLTTDVVYRVRFGESSRNIGSLGDLLVGATAAIAIFTVGSALFPEVKLNDFGHNREHAIRVIAVSVLSGYAGIRLLNPLTRKLVEQISREQAHEQVKTVKARSEELAINVKDGDRQLYRFDAEREHLLGSGQRARASELLDAARASYEVALKIDEQDTEALLGMAKVARRQAQLHEGAGELADPDWDRALALLDRITDRNPKVARAFYNKACYKQVQGQLKGPSSAALEDLKTAVSLRPELKGKAKLDPDFSSIRETAEFKAVVG